MQLIDLKLKVSTAEQEREFYFTKLRDIEVMCQMPEVKQERVRPLKRLLALGQLALSSNRGHVPDAWSQAGALASLGQSLLIVRQLVCHWNQACRFLQCDWEIFKLLPLAGMMLVC